jgi:signal transduction histidine kinase
MASHEFRTPLSTILASAHLLESCAHKWPEEKRLRNLRRIQAAGKNMTQLLNDILTINRAETGKLECHPQPIDLEKFCLHLVEEMQINADSKHKISFVSQGQCIKASVDEKLLRSILTNLLSNAIKYSPQGGEVHLALTCEQKEVIFQIQDQGIGIPPEDLPHLFEPFHRGTNVEHIAGTGLGITVVKKCLDLQGGKISLDSQVGVGTTVTVTIPLPTECRLI